ncbi:hypothetical protein [Nitrosospira briensis]|uniref:DUF4398 domain-containing protein n=1 Tax=Nitrosospira briensis TaxID=35799 RepID=A0A1I4YEI3_9PROT|nr:hypothetical protein [Nitrosospira briensis]SFN36183.1 hypothetical protein SAMN05216386_0645 [Nitrosospira briensis]SFN72380.1 hypothetical protein SAMN05216332_101362 [Nitrosospira briensis]
MKARIFFAILAVLGLLASCAHIDPHPMDMTSAIQSAKTEADHNALARHYQTAARAMQAKAREQKRAVAEYQKHGYYYGRQTEDLKEHAQALVRVYEEAAEANMSIAESHRQMAEQAR